jgi:hypothetical protein
LSHGLTAMHSTKPVPRRDVGEVAGGQVAVGLEAELLSEAESSLACRMVLVGRTGREREN